MEYTIGLLDGVNVLDTFVRDAVKQSGDLKDFASRYDAEQRLLMSQLITIRARQVSEAIEFRPGDATLFELKLPLHLKE